MTVSGAKASTKPRKVDILVFHNILWSHYKGRVFSELHKLCVDQSLGLFVVQYATTERRRNTLGPIDRELHQYPYRLMRDGAYDDLTLWTKIRIGMSEMRQKNPAVVVFPGYWDPSHWVLLAIARFQGRKVIISFDSTELDHRRYWIRELVKKYFISRCHWAFTYGQRSKRYLQKLGMPEERITIRCQATANEEIRTIFDRAVPDRGRMIEELGLAQRNFCYVGRLSSEKNVACVIRAIALLRRKNRRAKDWGLLIIGDGPDRESLIALCQREGLDRVKFAGGMSWRSVPRFLAASDVMLLPSISEPWGLVVNEAMVCGLAVVVSDHCGCVEDLVLVGRTGLTFDPHNPEDLCEKLEYLVLSPDEVQRLGKAARHIISSYTPESAARQMLHGINQVLISHC